MYRSFRFRRGLGVVLVAGFFICLAIGGSILLGRLYIAMLSKGQVNEGAAGSKAVSSEVGGKKVSGRAVVRLDAVPVYFLQAGVYSDLAGAQKSVGELKNLGYPAYISRVEPYRVYIGSYSDKDMAAEAKKSLDGKNISAYISSAMLNSSEMVIPVQKEIENPESVLKQFNEWLNFNLGLYNNQFAQVDSAWFTGELAKSEQSYNKFSKELSKVKAWQECFKHSYCFSIKF